MKPIKKDDMMRNEKETTLIATRYLRTADAVLRCVAGEHLLVPIRSGHLLDAESLYILDDVGAYVWNTLEGGCTLHELVFANSPTRDACIAPSREGSRSCGLILRRSGRR